MWNDTEIQLVKSYKWRRCMAMHSYALFLSVPINTRKWESIDSFDEAGTIVVYNFNLSYIGNIYILSVGLIKLFWNQ